MKHGYADGHAQWTMCIDEHHTVDMLQHFIFKFFLIFMFLFMLMFTERMYSCSVDMQCRYAT
jgi:hypothetical protein